MAVKYHEYASVFFVDDKAIVPFGEPERPLSLQMFEHVVELLHQEMKHLVHLILISIPVA